MKTYQESGLSFSFPASWEVRKYDGHHFYQALSGYGLKAVDFICLLPDGQLCLIEVKNYYPRLGKDGRFHPINRKKASELATTLAKKYSDSVRAIRVISRYYRTKWYYRWQLRLLPAVLLGYRSDLHFWTEAARRLDKNPAVLFLLWLETPKASKRYRTKIYAHLNKLAEDGQLQLLLGGNGNTPLGMPLPDWEGKAKAQL